MGESSAAGYQLRLHYQKYLLCLECNETQQNQAELNQFVESLRKPKKRVKTESDDGDASSKSNKRVKIETDQATQDSEQPNTSASNVGQSLTEMAQNFKNHRIKYSRFWFFYLYYLNLVEYSQKDTAESICGCFQTDMSQTTISRFETCKLSARNMESVRHLLEEWVEKVVSLCG
jgi:hypothetical protein